MLRKLPSIALLFAAMGCGAPASDVDDTSQDLGCKTSCVDPRAVGAAERIEAPTGFSPAPDYAGLVQNGKLDVRVFVGFDHAGNDDRLFRAINTELQSHGWKLQSSDPTTSPAVFGKPVNLTGKPAAGTVKVTLGRSESDPQAAMTADLHDGSVVIYNGHSTHGRGLAVGDGVMLEIAKDDFRLASDRYQLLVIASCTSDQYYDAPVGNATAARNAGTLDLLLTTRDTKFSEFVTQTIYSLEQRQDLDQLARAVSESHGSSFLWDEDTTANDLLRDQMTYDTRRKPGGALTADATTWALATSTLHIHLRATGPAVQIPGSVVPAEFAANVDKSMQAMWRRLVISRSGTERAQWRRYLSNAVVELDKLLINCKDNREHFHWQNGTWSYDDNEGVSGSAAYDSITKLRDQYDGLLQQSRDPAALAKMRGALVPKWLAEHGH